MPRLDLDDLPAEGVTITYPGAGPLADLARSIGRGLADHRGILFAPVRGLWLLVVAVLRWATDQEGRVERKALAGGEQAHVRLAVDERHRATMALRAKITAGTALGASLAAFWAWSVLSTVSHVLVVLGAVVALGAIGRDELANETAVDPLPEWQPGGPITDHAIRDALAIAVPKVDPERVSIVTPAHAMTAGGWAAEVALPPGRTADEARKAAPQVASALGITVDRLILSRGKDSEAHVSIAALDTPLRNRTLPPSPYLRSELVNVFDGIEVGRDALGRPVYVPLIHVNAVVGSMPRVGKTTIAIHTIAAASLDPRVEIHVHSWKRCGDFAPFEPIATYLRTGSDPEDFTAARADLKAIQAEIDRRGRVLEDLRRAGHDDAQVTDALADDPTLGLHPILLVWDEVQVAFEDDDLAARFEDIVRRGPFAGVVCWDLTQRPDDKSIPRSLSASCDLRISLAQKTVTASNMTLGDGMSPRGIDASQWSSADKGIAYVDSPMHHGDPIVTQCHYLTGSQARGIVERAAERRPAPGLRAPVVEPAGILDRLREAWPTTAGRPAAGLHLAEAANVADCSVDELRAAMADDDLPVVAVSRRVDGTPTSRHGIRWEHLDRGDERGEPGSAVATVA